MVRAEADCVLLSNFTAPSGVGISVPADVELHLIEAEDTRVVSVRDFKMTASLRTVCTHKLWRCQREVCDVRRLHPAPYRRSTRS